MEKEERGGGRKKGDGEAKEERDAKEIYCGLGNCRPPCLQRCAHIYCVTLALSFAGLCTATLSKYVNSQITALERQFGFSSSVSGVLLNSHDFGYLLTTLFMAYLTRRVHILRIISLSSLLFGISGLICTVPFFASLPDLPSASDLLAGSGTRNQSDGGISGESSHSGDKMMEGRGSVDHYLCSLSGLNGPPNVWSAQNDSIVGKDKCGSEVKRQSIALSEDKKWLAIGFIGLGMIIKGLAKSPRWSFISTYIDDNVSQTKTTLYLGIVTSCSNSGAILAYALGGLFSGIYLTLENTTMTPRDPRWVGAWWLGFLVFGFMGILASIPTLFLPRRLRPQPHLRQLEAEEKHSASGSTTYCCNPKEFLKSLIYLVRTPVYACLVLGTCCLTFSQTGMFAFLPKYLETQFMIPSWKANVMLGVLRITSSVAHLISGIFLSHFKLSPRSCLKMVIGISLLSAIFVSSGFFFGCDQPAISKGSSTGDPVNGQRNVTMTCSSNCHCDDIPFFPICGSDSVTYFSPCHAGCSKRQGTGFKNCSCVNSTMTSPLQMTLSTRTTGGKLDRATAGFCQPACAMLYPYAAMIFLACFLLTLTVMPTFLAKIRSTSESDKPLGIGLDVFLSKILGKIPSRLVYGWIVDSACLLWSSGCDGKGSCTLYDLVSFRYRYHMVILSSHVFGSLFFIAAFVIVIVKKVKFSPHQDDYDAIVDSHSSEADRLMTQKSGRDKEGVHGSMDQNIPLQKRGKILQGK